MQVLYPDPHRSMGLVLSFAKTGPNLHPRIVDYRYGIDYSRSGLDRRPKFSSDPFVQLPSRRIIHLLYYSPPTSVCPISLFCTYHIAWLLAFVHSIFSRLIQHPLCRITIPAGRNRGESTGKS